MTFIKAHPKADYGEIAKALLGEDHGEARKKIRDKMHYMRRMEQLEMGDDGRWVLR